jgi:hypothetical protein
MTIPEIIKSIENATTLVDINTGLTSLCDIILSNSTMSDEDNAKLARLRAQVTIVLSH